ncbi:MULTISPECIES: hypothetical protein [unclassified Mycolicibacterium]|uniref:hypothetical protein n=1 Tax=unclassified Mycolicibacterium TaxID=2636767 RepID=UPI0012DCCAF2|nr:MULTISPECIES: hypothetical protein [unclassified Mycolicibacterium]
MAQGISADDTTKDGAASASWLARVGSDWWATILGLAITALAVAGLLPKIGW